MNKQRGKNAKKKWKIWGNGAGHRHVEMVIQSWGLGFLPFSLLLVNDGSKLDLFLPSLSLSNFNLFLRPR